MTFSKCHIKIIYKWRIYMAEFCVECWKEINGYSINENDVILSRDLELCEGCGEWTKVVIRIKEDPLMYL